MSNNKSYKLYCLTDHALERIRSAIKRKFSAERGSRNIYKESNNSYIYSSLSEFLKKDDINFKMRDETLKFILERTTGVRKSTIESLFNKLAEPFSDNFIVDFQDVDENIVPHKYNTLSKLKYSLKEEFVGRETEIEKIIDLVRIDKSRPYIIVIFGSSGVGKTYLVTKISKEIERSEDHLLAYESIIYIEFKKKYTHDSKSTQREDDSKNNLSENESMNDFSEMISIELRDNSIIADQTRYEEKIYTALERQKTLLIIDNFHNINLNERTKISNFLVSLPISTKVIVTTQETNLLGYQFKLEDMPKNDANDISNKLINQKESNIEQISITNPLANVIVTNWAIENKEHPPNDKCDVDSDQLACYLGIVLNPYIEKSTFCILISIALFDSIEYNSHLEISGVSHSSSVERLVSKWVDLGLVYTNERKYFMKSGVKDFILKEIEDDKYYDRVQSIFMRAYEYYFRMTTENGGIDWGNWKDKYGRINEQWSNIKSILIYLLTDKNEGYKKIIGIWNNVNHFADMCGYYNDRLKWLDWILSQSKDRSEWIEYTKCLSRSAWTLYMIGGDEKQKKALSRLDEAINILKDEWVKDDFETKLNELNVLHHYVKILLRNGSHKKAFEKLEEQRNIIQTINESNIDKNKFKLFIRCKINYLRDLAQYYKKENSKEAKKLYLEVLDLSEQNDWQRGIALAANHLADIEIDNAIDGNLSQAEAYLHQAIEIADFNEYERRQAHCNLSYAKLECKRKNKVKAKEYVERAFGYYQRFERDDKINEIKEIENFLDSLE